MQDKIQPKVLSVMDTHIHIPAKRGAAPSNTQPKGWLWYHALKLSISDHFTTRITYSEWEAPGKSQNPTHPPAQEVRLLHHTEKLPTFRSYREQRKECWTQPAKHSPGRPISGKVVKLWLECCSTSLKVKNTRRVIHVHAKTHLPSSLTSAWLCGREACCHNLLFSRESQGLSYPPKGTHGAPIAATHNQKEGSQVP